MADAVRYILLAPAKSSPLARSFNLLQGVSVGGTQCGLRKQSGKACVTNKAKEDSRRRS